MIVSRISQRRFSDDPTAAAPVDQTNLDVSLKPSTVTSGIMLWVAAGVITHLAIRFIDAVLDKKRT